MISFVINVCKMNNYSVKKKNFFSRTGFDEILVFKKILVNKLCFHCCIIKLLKFCDNELRLLAFTKLKPKLLLAKQVRPSNSSKMTTFSAMLSKKEEGLDFSPLHYQFKSDGNFEEVSFADLLQKQNNSKRKDLLSQLGQMGGVYMFTSYG